MCVGSLCPFLSISVSTAHPSVLLPISRSLLLVELLALCRSPLWQSLSYSILDFVLYSNISVSPSSWLGSFPSVFVSSGCITNATDGAAQTTNIYSFESWRLDVPGPGAGRAGLLKPPLSLVCEWPSPPHVLKWSSSVLCVLITSYYKTISHTG